ncbi:MULTISPECIES: hypothetical protein, partial [Enterobacteriaceae]|uniref:hypothetical protein n=1 Tax=Enterobacteriaceae TaxID=543 RepID=UPI000ABD6E8D
EWVHVQLHQQKGMISLSPPTICNSAIRSVAEHRLHGAGKQFADLYSRIDGATVTLTPEDQLLLATMPFNIQDVEDIVNERGPKTISGRPFWEVEPGPHDYEYGPQYPYFPDQR